ncbi:MAG: SDR family NAD(P)-dependent oxidoreductase [Candidatus Kariarchaeaceae archaeon]|jgi:gluconate 5-dehydrogenase
MTVLDLFKLTGKNALVTGGAKGIGTKINESLLEAGVNALIFCGRGRHGSIEEEQARLQEKFPDRDIRGVKCDITNEADIDSMIEAIQDLKSLEILVNNAGVTWLAPTMEQTLKSWHRTIDTNLTGTFLVCRNIIRDLMLGKCESASIINIASISGIKSSVEAALIGYTTSKAGMLGLTRQLAIEFASNDIRCNAILPGFIEGDTMAELFTKEGSPIREALIEVIPLRRFVSANDIKGLVTFLASEASVYITGQSIVLAGGVSVKI